MIKFKSVINLFRKNQDSFLALSQFSACYNCAFYSERVNSELTVVYSCANYTMISLVRANESVSFPTSDCIYFERR